MRHRPPAEPVSLAATAVEIVRRASDPSVRLRDLANLARADPAFAVRVLRVANSAAFRRAKPTSDLRQAVVLLGLQRMRTVALSMLLTDMAPAGEDADVLLAACLRRAAAARLLATTTRLVHPDQALTMGLLIEFGLLIVAGATLPGAAELARTPAYLRAEVERASGWQSHAAAGGQVAERLGLGVDLTRAIQCHHDPRPPEANLARLGWAAERFASLLEGGDPARLQADLGRAAGALSLSGEEVNQVLMELPGVVRELGRAFDRDTGPQPDLVALLRDVTRQLVDQGFRNERLQRRLLHALVQRAALVREVAEQRPSNSLDRATGLFVRSELNQALERELADSQRHGVDVALLVVAPDSQATSAATRDALLQHVAAALEARVRPIDLAARFDQDSVGLVLSHTAARPAGLMAERLCQRIALAPAQTPEGPVHTTVSIGVVAGNAQTTTAARMLDLAVQALAAARAGEGGQVRVAVPAARARGNA